MESLTVLLVGIAVRFAFFLLLFTALALPIVGVLYAAQGVAALHARVKGTVDAGGIHWKPGVAYTAAHSWVKRTWGRTVKVGLDDVARRILSGASSFALPAVGTRLRRGDLLATVQCGNHLVAVPCPVDGIVVARNRALMSEPSLFDREPYGAGWMLRIETDGPPDEGARRGRTTRAWLHDENARLSRLLEHQLGIAAADGGTLTGPPATLLTSDAWRETVEQFLSAA